MNLASFFLDLPDYEALRVLLRDRSAKTGGPWTLASGKQSDFYVDCRLTTLLGRGSLLVGTVGYAAAERIESDCHRSMFDGVGGLTMGADPMAVAIAQAAWIEQQRDWTAISVRKGEKKHGMKRMIEGGFQADRVYLVVDDVCTTGGSTIEAIRKIREAGGIVKAALVLLDREEDGGAGAAAIEAEDVKFFSIFTRTTLMAP